MPQILLVDDDADVRGHVVQVLVGARYDVDPAATLGAARGLIIAHLYDLVLADGELPDG